MKFLSKTWPEGLFVLDETSSGRFNPFRRIGYDVYRNIIADDTVPNYIYRKPGEDDLYPQTKLHKLLKEADETSGD